MGVRTQHVIRGTSSEAVSVCAQQNAFPSTSSSLSLTLPGSRVPGGTGVAGSAGRRRWQGRWNGVATAVAGSAGPSREAPPCS